MNNVQAIIDKQIESYEKILNETQIAINALKELRKNLQGTFVPHLPKANSTPSNQSQTAQVEPKRRDGRTKKVILDILLKNGGLMMNRDILTLYNKTTGQNKNSGDLSSRLKSLFDKKEIDRQITDGIIYYCAKKQ